MENSTRNSILNLCIDAFVRSISNECYFEKIDEKFLNETGLSSNDVFLPEYATKQSAGADFFSPFNFTLQPGEEIKIPTGIKAHCAKWTRLSIVPKSGLGFKYYTRLANTIGTIDQDYYENPENDGCIFVKLRNEGDKPFSITKGQSFCQGIFELYFPSRDYFNTSYNERVGGLGSTDARTK